MRFKITILLLYFYTFSPGCGKDDFDCIDCQKAIDHMFEKIQNYNCDPVAFMQNAVNGITAECGSTLAPLYIGFMAETCNLGVKKKVLCKEILNRDNLSIIGLNINFQKTTTSFDTVKVTIYVGQITKEFNIFSTGVYPIVLNEEVEEGSDVNVEVYYKGNLIGSGQKKFSFVRVDYHDIRGVRLVLSGQSLQVNFESW